MQVDVQPRTMAIVILLQLPFFLLKADALPSDRSGPDDRPMDLWLFNFLLLSLLFYLEQGWRHRSELEMTGES
jgi:hypothetical protein